MTGGAAAYVAGRQARRMLTDTADLPFLWIGLGLLLVARVLFVTDTTAAEPKAHHARRYGDAITVRRTRGPAEKARRWWRRWRSK